MWDSGRIDSGSSAGVAYAGRELRPSTRYFWRVKVWDKDGKPYPPSDVSWWETGLLGAGGWRGRWIGYELPEERLVREADAAWIGNAGTGSYQPGRDARHDFRLSFDLARKARRGVLYVTGQDSAAAWINGSQVLESRPLPPWNQTPWKTYSRVDATDQLRAGANLLAIEVVRYFQKSSANANLSRTPMSATLYVEFADGRSAVYKTGTGDWKTALDAPGRWFAPETEAGAAWSDAVPYAPVPSASERPAPMGRPWTTGSVKLLRSSFQVGRPVKSARLYATALGSYKFYLNGRAVGDQFLAPGWTDYRERVVYQTYDVTAALQSGANAIGAYLAPGWYATPLEWFRQGNNYGIAPPALKAQLRIEDTGGSVEWVVTGEAWKAGVSPILSAEIYDGEAYDARLAQPGWDTAGFSDARWQPAALVQPREPEIVAQDFPPIRAHQVLQARAIATPKEGTYIYDFGQNLSGLPRLRIQGPAGTEIRLRFGEELNADGSLYVENLRTAKATDRFILAGRGVEEYQPAFTFHGFRYAELTGMPSRPDLETLKVVVLHTDAPFAAQLRTGTPMVNQVWSNILWGQRSNFVGIPSDCPQRDERLGWTADAQVFWRTAAFNMDLTAFSRKYARDLRGTQTGTALYGIYAPGTASSNPGWGPGWSDAGVIVPWTSWIQTGDNRILEQNWEAMEKYLAAIQASNPNYLWTVNTGNRFGDWLSPEGATAEELLATAYWAYDATLMRQMAHALGRAADETKYGELFRSIQTAFQQAYVGADGVVAAVPSGLIAPAGTEAKAATGPVETQTGYVLALHMGLLPESLRSVAARRLVDRIAANGWRLGTGFLGTPYLMGVLTDTGHADVAYRLLLNTQYPSWGYLVEHGATTMWERWNGDQMRGDPSMNSYNHYAYGVCRRVALSICRRDRYRGRRSWIPHDRSAPGLRSPPGQPGFLLRVSLRHDPFHLGGDGQRSEMATHHSAQFEGAVAVVGGTGASVPARRKGYRAEYKSEGGRE